MQQLPSSVLSLNLFFVIHCFAESLQAHHKVYAIRTYLHMEILKCLYSDMHKHESELIREPEQLSFIGWTNIKVLCSSLLLLILPVMVRYGKMQGE